MTVYIEQILLVNLLASGSLLWITARLWGRAIAWGRLAASSAAAALWAAASTLPTLTALRSPWAWGAGIAAVTLLCYLPGGIRDFLRLWLTLWGATLLAGGAALAVDSLLGAPYAYACAPLGLAAAALTARFALPGWRGGARSFRVTISRPGRKGFPALIDSGNCLTEPLSGLPVIVAGPDAGRELLGMPLEALSEGVRWIPLRTASGGGALPALPVSDICVEREGEKEPCGAVYVAVTVAALPGGVSALVPPLPHLLQNGRKPWNRCVSK
jgi:hypothetical protein